MEISVPKLSPADDAAGHLIHTFEWPRLIPGSVRWVNARGEELVEYGLASKSLAECIEDEQRFLEFERIYRRELASQGFAPFDIQAETYRPLDDEPSLFKVFADLDGSEEAFAAFAERFGILGLAVLAHTDDELAHELDGETREPLAVWLLIWHDIRECSRLLDLVQRGRVPELRKLVEFHEKSVRVVFPGYDPKKRRYSQVGSVAFKESILPFGRMDLRWPAIQSARSERARLEMAARFFVQAKASKWLAGRVFPEVSAGCVVISEQGKSFGLRFQPSNLASAMWLQVARALEGDVAYRQCKSSKCRKWFVVSSDRSIGRRSDSLYCGDPKCRKEVFREKRRRGSKR